MRRFDGQVMASTTGCLWRATSIDDSTYRLTQLNPPSRKRGAGGPRAIVYNEMQLVEKGWRVIQWPYGTQSGTSILAEEKTPKETGSKPESDPN